MSAGARGEVSFQAGEHEIRVLFTNRALANVENQLGRGIVALLQDMAQGSTGINDTVVLLQAGMEAARRDAREPGPAVSLDRAFHVMDAAGFGPVLAAVMEAAAEVLAHGQTQAQAAEDQDPNP